LKFQDKRCGKVAVVAHCVLNQNSRISGLAHYPAVIDEIVDILKKHNVGFLQMPCPELTYAKAKRPSKTREEYNTPSYRKHCTQIAISTTNQIERFVKNDAKTIVVLGVKNSPSCDISDSTKETGILMEELRVELEKAQLEIPMHAINISKIATNIKWLEDNLKTV